MDVDKLIRGYHQLQLKYCFGTMMDVDKLIHSPAFIAIWFSFGTMMDVDKLILGIADDDVSIVLGL